MEDSRNTRLLDGVPEDGCLLLSLVGLTTVDIVDFSGIIRPIVSARKDDIHIALFPSEEEKCPENVWATFAALVRRGIFMQPQAGSYSELFSRLAGSGKKVFAIVRESTERAYVASQNGAGAELVFCDIRDGRLAACSVPSPAARKEPPEPPPQAEEPARPPVPDSGNRPYSIASRPDVGGIHRLNITEEVHEGSVLRDSGGGIVRLVSRELRNNGAYTYSTSRQGFWAKIYDDDYNSSFFENKVRRMLRDPVRFRGICWPVDALTDSAGVFRGYIMPACPGQPLLTGVLKRSGQEKHFPGWKKEDLCTLASEILEKVVELHKNGVLFGCINPAAIRVASQSEVYFCDTDDYQIEGFPTLTTNVSFSAPENLGKKFYMATPDSENFSVAVLVFMLMMTGRTPYLTGKDDAVRAIRRMNFPFHISDVDRKNPSLSVLPSMWRYVWSHLSHDMKAAFCSTFQKGEKNSARGKRLPASRWLSIVRSYRKELERSEFPDDHSLYPSSFRRKKGEVFYQCTKCGREHPKFFFDSRYFDNYRVCNACMELPSDVSYKCVNCQRTFIYKNRTALFHQLMKSTHDDWKKQRHCPECKSKREACSSCGKLVPYYELTEGYCRDCLKTAVYTTRTCTSCGDEFSITYREKMFYDSKGLTYPKRCPECRKNKKSGGGGGGRNTRRRENQRPEPSRPGFFSRLFGI